MKYDEIILFHKSKSLFLFYIIYIKKIIGVYDILISSELLKTLQKEHFRITQLAFIFHLKKKRNKNDTIDAKGHAS